MTTRNAFKTLRSATNLGIKLTGEDFVLPTLERRVIGKWVPNLEDVMPVFILGAFRTGSTILYELLVSVYRPAFFSSLAALFFRSPTLITRMLRSLELRHRFSSRSTYGYVNGLCAPSEAKAIHDSWFGDPSENREVEIEPDIPLLTVLDMADSQRRPFVSKNLKNNLRLGQISLMYPEADYLYIKRRPIYTAQFIFLVRSSSGEP